MLTSLAVGAAILIFNAVRTEKHRWLNVALVAVMISAVAFDWIIRVSSVAGSLY